MDRTKNELALVDITASYLLGIIYLNYCWLTSFVYVYIAFSMLIIYVIHSSEVLEIRTTKMFNRYDVD